MFLSVFAKMLIEIAPQKISRAALNFSVCRAAIAFWSMHLEAEPVLLPSLGGVRFDRTVASYKSD